MADQLTTYIPPESTRLPDNGQWTNRFEVRSASSNRIYVIAQHREHRHWGCSCPAWRTRRTCKHLTSVGLPSHERPHEIGERRG
jgi:hypothetical protein